MNDFRLLSRRIAFILFVLYVSFSAMLFGAIGALINYLNLSVTWSVFSGVVLVLVSGYIVSAIATKYALDPLRFLWQAILHVSPNSTVSPPDLNKLRAGRELVTKLSHQVYQFASQQDSQELINHRKSLIQASAVVSRLPLPLFVFNKELLVTQASDKALDYCQVESTQLFGQPLFHSLNLEFPSSRTLEAWITECQQTKVTDESYWERVRVRLPDGKNTRLCDIAAHYNRDNPSGAEFIVTIFDRTERYKQDEDSMGFIALAVHELRTPLTMLRGYIEVFEEELADKLSDDMKNFMYKMEVSAKQLSTFVSNILNVARVDDNQLVLHLAEEKWDKVLKHACEDAELKAKVHGKNIEYQITQGLPTVAVDRISMYEVMSNLIDNAIKYSENSKNIIVSSSLGRDGLVETTVQDFGVGIPQSVLPNLFEKFYRNHRTRSQIGGSGLGLYLCKSIVNAHGGQIWVKSKESEGSTFGFSLKPYSEVAEELKTGNNEVTRTAHGWIKNHSIYRR